MLTPSSTLTVGMALASVRPGEIHSDDVEGLLAVRQLRGDAVADVLADERAGQRRQDRDAPLRWIRLVGADDPVPILLAGLVLELHGRGERDPAARSGRVDHLGGADLGLELGNAPFDEALLLAGRVVLGVFR